MNMKTIASKMLWLAVTLSIALPNAAFAATTPSFGMAGTYGVLGSTYTNTSAGTTINGDVGFTTGPAVAPAGVHVNYGAGAPYAQAGIDQGAALTALATQVCTFNFPAGAIDLSTDITHGAIGIYTPGVYCSVGAMNIGGPIQLNGNGTYIFKTSGALTSTAGAVVTTSGVTACDVFWIPTQATTLAANTTFVGTVIDNAGITVGANTTWTGMAWSFGGTITTDTTTLTVPMCVVPPPPPPAPATLRVVKTVVNGFGGTATPAQFSLHVQKAGIEVTGSPAPGVATPGTTYSLSGGTYIISEDTNPLYTPNYSGDCDTNGLLTLTGGDIKTCTITNNQKAVNVGAPVPSLPTSAVVLPVSPVVPTSPVVPAVVSSVVSAPVVTTLPTAVAPAVMAPRPTPRPTPRVTALAITNQPLAPAFPQSG